jgi:hypothetical protein
MATPRRFPTAARAVAVVVVGVSAFVSGTDVAGAAKKTKDACKVVTTKEITSAFGANSVAKGFSGFQECNWKLDGGPPNGINLSVQLLPNSTSGYDAAKQVAGTGAETVDGLGKDAFFQAGTGTLWIVKGKTSMSLQGVSLNNPVVKDKVQLQEALEALAENALERV